MLARLYRAALEGVDPAVRVAETLADPQVTAALRDARAVGAFAVGKAAAGMLRGAVRFAKVAARAPTGHGLCFSGAVAILPRGQSRPALPGVEVVFSSHPEPDRSSLAAARRALAFFRSFGREDLILCLVSGGTSSLLCLPREGMTLAKKRQAVSRLTRSGASILQINRLRTSLSAVKGGALGRATRARLVTLVLSDVPGDRLSAVGSGPTIRGRKGDLVRVVGSNVAGLAAAAQAARRHGLAVRLERRRLSGEARDTGARFARRAGHLRMKEVLLAGGETTVTLPARHGRGGRNLEFALGAALEIGGEERLTVLAAGSDGRDGTSSATGAFADGSTLGQARRRGLDARAALRRHSTDAFFRALGGLLETGPTGTNVADWAFAVRR